MKNDIIKLTIKQMDHVDLAEKFKCLCQEGINIDVMMKFMGYVIPCYELEKKKVLSGIINTAAYAIVDQLLEDPLDSRVANYLSQLKNIANYLNIEIDAISK